MKAISSLLVGVAFDAADALPSRLTYEELQVILSGQSQPEKAFAQINSASHVTTSLAFRTLVFDYLFKKEQSFFMAHLKVRENFSGFSMSDEFGPRVKGAVYEEDISPSEILRRIVNQACYEAHNGVSVVIGRGLLSSDLQSVCARTEDATRRMIENHRGELASELYLLGRLHEYFSEFRRETIDQAVLQVQDEIARNNRQQAWAQSWDSTSKSFTDNALQPVYEATQCLWNSINLYAGLGISTSFKDVCQMPQYSAVKEIGSPYAREHVDELLLFMLQWRKSPGLLRKELAFSQAVLREESQALDVAGNLGRDLQKPLPIAVHDFIAHLMVEAGLITRV